MTQPTRMTARYAEAVDYARVAHAKQVRKGTNVPYLYHLLGVSSLVLRYGGNETQAIAGLLHDTIEDAGAHHERVIRKRFGATVARIVVACSDDNAEQKRTVTTRAAKRADWRRRNLAYLEHLKHESQTVQLVVSCDKLHNASSIVEDLEAGEHVFKRFNATKPQTLAYYESLSRTLRRHPSKAGRALDRMVGRMHELAGSERRGLEELGGLRRRFAST